MRLDEERSRFVTEGEGENAKTREVFEHHTHKSKDKFFKQVITISQVGHVLPPGEWAYPFSYNLPKDFPGIVKYRKTSKARDPHHHDPLVSEASVVFKLKACLETHGKFSRDLKSRQELTVNPYFDWATLQPQAVTKKGEVYWCCCFPQGEVTLDCRFDRGAYAGGETAQIAARIKNDSACDVAHMKVKLMRFITLSDGKGHTHRYTDCLAESKYDGVVKKSEAGRHLPLPLKMSGGQGFLSSIKTRNVEVRYQIEVECDISMAFDIEAHLPVTIYQPAPAVNPVMAMFPGGMPAFAVGPGAMMTAPASGMPAAGGMGMMGGGGAMGGAGAMPMGGMPGAGMGMGGMPGAMGSAAM